MPNDADATRLEGNLMHGVTNETKKKREVKDETGQENWMSTSHKSTTQPNRRPCQLYPNSALVRVRPNSERYGQAPSPYIMETSKTKRRPPAKAGWVIKILLSLRKAPAHHGQMYAG